MTVPSHSQHRGEAKLAEESRCLSGRREVPKSTRKKRILWKDDHCQFFFPYFVCQHYCALSTPRGPPSPSAPMKIVDFLNLPIDGLWFRLQTYITRRTKEWWRAKSRAEFTCQTKSNMFCLVSHELWTTFFQTNHSGANPEESTQSSSRGSSGQHFLRCCYRPKEELAELK